MVTAVAIGDQQRTQILTAHHIQEVRSKTETRYSKLQSVATDLNDKAIICRWTVDDNKTPLQYGI